MNRRSFAAFTVFGLARQLVARSSRAEELEKSEALAAKSDPGTQGSGLDTDELVARMEAFYAKVTTFKASFKQGNNFLPNDRKTTFDGSVLFERPGKMSWRYSGGNRVVSDGSRITVYERETKQMYEQELEQSQYPAVLSFLTMHGKLTQNFKFSQIEPKPSNNAGRHVLLGAPLQHSSAYERLQFYVDARTYEVRRVLLRDAAGNRNRFDFFRRQVNPQVPRGEFGFSSPPGTRIIRLQTP